MIRLAAFGRRLKASGFRLKASACGSSFSRTCSYPPSTEVQSPKSEAFSAGYRPPAELDPLAGGRF
jgi:hypothetical protein